MLTKTQMPSADQALPGRSDSMSVPSRHYVNGNSLTPPFPENTQKILFAMGCFWGAERKMWQCEGVYSTAVGYAAGYTPNPSYEEVCSGLTGHTEVVLVIYEDRPEVLQNLLKVYWESHDPTQGMRQGNDVGTQYRSGIYTYTEAQQKAAEHSLTQFQQALSSAKYGSITSEIQSDVEFYYAESYHQQYLAKNPNGYCGLGGTGVCLV